MAGGGNLMNERAGWRDVIEKGCRGCFHASITTGHDRVLREERRECGKARQVMRPEGHGVGR